MSVNDIPSVMMTGATKNASTRIRAGPMKKAAVPYRLHQLGAAGSAPVRATAARSSTSAMHASRCPSSNRLDPREGQKVAQ